MVLSNNCENITPEKIAHIIFPLCKNLSHEIIEKYVETISDDLFPDMPIGSTIQKPAAVRIFQTLADLDPVLENIGEHYIEAYYWACDMD